MGENSLSCYCAKEDLGETIEICHEIQNWRTKHGKNPTIIIDIIEFIRTILYKHDAVSFSIPVEIGGRYQKFNEILEYFFGEMKNAGAKLVFIVKKGVNKHHYYSDINDHLTYNLTHSLCSKYGEFIINYGLNKSSILTYARQNQDNVMALITRDPAFLVFDCEYSYWCLHHMDFYKMTIMKFSLHKLRDKIGLNQLQMKLLYAFCYVFGKVYKIHYLFYIVKDQKITSTGCNPDELKGDFSENERNMIVYQLNYLISIDNYNGSYTEDIYDDELIYNLINTDKNFADMLIYFKHNNYYAYNVIQNPKICLLRNIKYLNTKQPHFYTFIKLITNISIKLYGIMFKDVDPMKQPKSRLIVQKFYNTDLYDFESDIIYPTMRLPTLNQLIIDEANQQFDESRYVLLKWLLGIDEEAITIFKSAKSKYIGIVLLTLYISIVSGSITNREADIILLTEIDGNTKNNVYVPKRFRMAPPMPDWTCNYKGPSIRIAHKYTITFQMVCHSLELCGLRKYTDVIKFDAYQFYANMKLANNNDRQIQRALDNLRW